MVKWLIVLPLPVASVEVPYVDNYFDCQSSGEYVGFRDELLEILRLRKLAELTEVEGARMALLHAADEIEGQAVATAAGIFTMMSDADYPKLAHDHFKYLYNNVHGKQQK